LDLYRKRLTRSHPVGNPDALTPHAFGVDEPAQLLAEPPAGQIHGNTIAPEPRDIDGASAEMP